MVDSFVPWLSPHPFLAFLRVRVELGNEARWWRVTRYCLARLATLCTQNKATISYTLEWVMKVYSFFIAELGGSLELLSTVRLIWLVGWMTNALVS